MTDRPSEGGTERLRELHHAATDIMAASDVATVYETTVDKAETVLGFDFCSVFVRADEGFEVVASSHREPGTTVAERDGVLERTYREKTGILVRDVSERPDAKPRREGVESGVSVPIGERAVLQAVSDARGYYTEPDLELAELLAIHAEAAVQQVRSRELVREQKRKMAELHTVATEIESCQNTDELYELMREASEEILGFDWCTLYVLEDGEFVTEMTSEQSPVTVGERPFSSGESKAREVLETGESNRFDDVREIEEGEPTSDRIRSVLQVPVGDVGVYNAAHERPGRFDEDDLELAELLASSVAEALDRIRAQERLRSQKRELEQKNERLDRFASFVSHDLKGPLSVAQGRAELVARDGAEEHLEALERSLDRMETMIDELLTLARAGQRVESSTEESLHDTVTRAWENVQPERAELRSHLDGVTVEADHERLLHVFENLFRNAVDHNDRPVVVTVGPLESASGFYVADDGQGIPDEDRGSVFDRGYTTSDDGSGYGLPIVETVVEAHGWTVEVTESDDGGARFEVRTD